MILDLKTNTKTYNWYSSHISVKEEIMRIAMEEQQEPKPRYDPKPAQQQPKLPPKPPKPPTPQQPPKPRKT
jgi:hypothetical protein